MNLPIQKSPRIMKWLHQQILLKEELTPILLKLFQTIEEEEILPNSFYKGTITLLPKRDKGTTRKLQTNITGKYRYKNYQRNIFLIFKKIIHKNQHTKFKNTQKELYTRAKWDLPLDARMVQHMPTLIQYSIESLDQSD